MDVLPTRARQRKDRLLMLLVGLAVGLTALQAFLVVRWGDGQPVGNLPWYVPLTHGLVGLAAAGVVFLSLGRYQVLREPAPLWIGLGFGAFAIFALFYVLSWPGLLPGDDALAGGRPDLAAWFWHLQFSALAACLLIAIYARWPRVGTWAERNWPWLAAAALALCIAVGLGVEAFHRLLPSLVVDESWTALNVWWIYALLVAYAASAALSAGRYKQTGDSIFGYLAATELFLAFAMLTGVIGGGYFDTWWYWQRVLWIGGLLAVLFGLLYDYVALYRREREQADQLRVLLETAPIGIAFYSAADGCLEVANSTASELLGQPLIPGQRRTAQIPAQFGLYRPNGEPLRYEELPSTRALRGEVCLGEEVLIRQPSGREVHVLVNATPQRDANRRVVGAVVAFQDITAIRVQERLRDEFLSAAAHELKTPVTTVKGYAQLLRRWAPLGHEPREGQAFEVIDTQCDRMTRRVDELLEVAQQRSVPPQPRQVRFDLSEMAAEVARRVQATTQAHRLIVRPSRPAPVEADRERIEEVLSSLLDNAIRYSPGGGDVEVSVWAADGEAVVSVRDHGVGIPAERQPHIFEPFYEPVPAGLRGYSGVVPLSLYLSKLIVERHGGRIQVRSVEGQGSTFSFTLPLRPAGTPDHR